MKKFCLIVFGLIFFLTSQATPQNKVVVIPLFGDKDTSSTPPAPVEKTGQMTCSDEFGMVIDCSGSGQDGELQKGVVWPNPRFTDNLDGTVTDNLTGLIWLKNANCAGLTNDWETALDYAAALYDGCTNCLGTNGDCGLSDFSITGDWRLPNIKELLSLIDYSNTSPALPSGHPFTNVGGTWIWSSTTYGFPASRNYAWALITSGHLDNLSKTNTNNVWPVRGGN